MNAQIDISNTILRTKRLILRPWKKSDLDDFFEYASVDGVGQMAGWLPHKDKAESEIILNKFIEGKRTFALEYNDKVIGSLGIEKYDEEKLKEFDDKKCRSIGYVLSKDYWGNGLMAEAVKEVIRYLFEDVGLDIILCGRFMFNNQSKRVQDKSGFKHYSYGTYFANQLNKELEHELNILTKQDWLDNKE